MSDADLCDRSAVELAALVRCGELSARTLLEADGILSVLLYSGHEGGMEEMEVVKAWTRGLSTEEFFVRTIESEPARDGRTEGRPELMLVTRI